MKILHLIDSGGLYGAEMMLLSLALQQQRMGASVVVGSIGKPGFAEKPLEKEACLRGITVKRFEMRPGPNIFGAWRILKFAWHNKVEIIHSHGYKTNILLGFLPRCIRRIPLVSTLHGWTSTGKWTKMRVNELLDSIALRLVDRVILVNQGMLCKQRIQALPQNKIIINNGIDILTVKDSFYNHEYPDQSLENRIKEFCSQGIVLISIGRLSIEKGYKFLIEATNRLRREHAQNVKLLLIGDGRLRSELEHQAEDAGLKDFFMITGYLNNARNLIAMADVYVISSLTEGLPITLLEAMASRTPIVATNVGGIPYVVEDGKDALIVQAEDSFAIVQAVLKLTRNPDLTRDLTSSAETKVKQHYSSEVMAKKYLSMYRDTLKNQQ